MDTGENITSLAEDMDILHVMKLEEMKDKWFAWFGSYSRYNRKTRLLCSACCCAPHRIPVENVWLSGRFITAKCWFANVQCLSVIISKFYDDRKGFLATTHRRQFLYHGKITEVVLTALATSVLATFSGWHIRHANSFSVWQQNNSHLVLNSSHHDIEITLAETCLTQILQ